MDLLRDNELIYGRLLPVDEPHLIERYNKALKAFGFKHTKLKSFEIDRTGFSPQIGEELGDMNYLDPNQVNRRFIILTPEQIDLPVVHTAFSNTSQLVYEFFQGNQRAIDALTIKDVIYGEIEDSVQKVEDIEDLLSINQVEFKVLSAEDVLGKAAELGRLVVAAGLADPGTDMQRRAGSLFTDAQRWLRPNAGANALEASLRTDYSDLFPTMRLPRRSEIDDVIDLSRTFIGSARQTEALGAMRNRLVHASVPWVQDDLPAASITAMGTLGGLRELVSASPPGDAEVVEALRTHLGDYREGDLPEPATLDDPIARTGYQLARGFDPTLTALPRAVVATMFSPFDSSDPVVDVDPDQVENAVRMLLKRLEKALRRFIADKLRELHGDNWFDALPSELRRSWTAGRQRDIENGRAPDEIIAYADLDHYRRIIEHPDRWERLFEPVFRDQAGIRETIKRIAVIRNPGAHFRAVTVEDLIILRAEGAHLSRWLGIRIGDS